MFLFFLFPEGSAGSLLSTTGSFRSSLLETTDLDYKRVSEPCVNLRFHRKSIVLVRISQKHRQLQHETSETLLANLSLGARFFAEGILGGITGIFVQPISGKQKLLQSIHKYFTIHRNCYRYYHHPYYYY